MAWIESHQELGAHPKTRKLAMLLDISRPATVGHLHYLWWWATDYAEDGDLSRFDPLDIAIGAEWDGDGNALVEALIVVGFLERDGERLLIHDWNQYAGKCIERRKANAERMRKARATHDTGTKKERATHVQRTQRARAELHNSTEQNSTEQDKPTTPPKPPPAAADAGKGVAKPFDLLVSLCEEIGQDVSILSQSERKKQCEFGKRLIDAGVGPDDVRRMTRWLGPQRWVIEGGGVDLKLLASQVGKWQINGRPDSSTPARASPANGIDRKAEIRAELRKVM